MENQPKLSLECLSNVEKQQTIDKIQEIAPLAHSIIIDFKMYPNGSLSILLELERKYLVQLKEQINKANISINDESVINFKYEISKTKNQDELIIVSLVFSRFIKQDI